MKLELSHRRCLSTRKHHAQSKIHPNSIPIYQNSSQFIKIHPNSIPIHPGIMLSQKKASQAETLIKKHMFVFTNK